MEFNQVKELLTVIRLNYPQSFRDYKKAQSEAYLAMMYEAFKDDPADLVISAVKAIIYGDTREFAPNIGQIKNKMFEMSNTGMSEQEAWSMVRKACTNGIYGADEEYAKLPPTIQKLVGSPDQIREWAMMDSDELNTVVASNFMRSYKVRSGKDKEYQMLPNDIKQMIGSLTNEMKMIGGKDDIDK